MQGHLEAILSIKGIHRLQLRIAKEALLEMYHSATVASIITSTKEIGHDHVIHKNMTHFQSTVHCERRVQLLQFLQIFFEVGRSKSLNFFMFLSLNPLAIYTTVTQ